MRGLDINSSYTIYNLLNEQKQSGVAVLFGGEDLDVLLELSDRIMVINAGKITGIVDARTITKEQVGKLMTADSAYDEAPTQTAEVAGHPAEGGKADENE